METQQTKKAVIYCRVSTKEQVEEGNSLVTQEKNCREYAAKNGYEIVQLFIEQGESAKTADRTELKKLMSFCAIKKNGVNAVISYKIDRISRNTDDYSQIRILLKRYGVEIKSTSEYFEDTPAGRFMENIIANVAQFDNDVRSERSTGGMKDAVREGRYVWLAPYGYSNVRVSGKATIAPNPLSRFVYKAFEEIALNNKPIEEIRKKLAAEGMVNSSGQPISKSNFCRLLKNELYTGWIYKFGEQHKGGFEPIITEEIFNQVQKVITGKPKKPKHYLLESPDFPLRRFFIHPSGKLLTGGWSKGRKKKYPYYTFKNLKINIRKEGLENSFKNLLNRFTMDIVHFDKIQAFVKKHLDNGFDNKKEDSGKLQLRIAELKTKQNIMLEKNIDGVISNELCRERIAEIDIEIYQLKMAIANLANATTNFSYLLNLIRDVLLNPGEAWEKADFREKIRLQWFYFPDGIEYDGIKSRTTKICKLFNVKEEFSTNLLRVVDHPNSNENTINLQNALLENFTLDLKGSNYTDDALYLYDLEEEIAYLANLVEPELVDDDQSCYFLKS